MFVLILGLIIFFGIHSSRIFAEDARTNFIAARGENNWKGVYVVASFIGLGLMVWGYGMAREAGPVMVFDAPVWTRHLNYVLMLPIFVMLISAYFPGRISAALKHPMLVAVKLWALGHLLANGDLASLLLFGAFLAWGVMDRISVKRRPVTAGGPPRAPASGANDIIAIVGGLGFYVAFMLWLHQVVSGVAIWPM
ncbi:MAG: NnrU family protein [Pseudomonadota bacterium]